LAPRRFPGEVEPEVRRSPEEITPEDWPSPEDIAPEVRRSPAIAPAESSLSGYCLEESTPKYLDKGDRMPGKEDMIGSDVIGWLLRVLLIR